MSHDDTDTVQALTLLFPNGIPLSAYALVVDLIQATTEPNPFAVTMRYVVDGLPSGRPKEESAPNDAPQPAVTVTSKEAAEYLGMTYAAFRNRVKREQIQPLGVKGRTHLFTSDELNRFKDLQEAKK